MFGKKKEQKDLTKLDSNGAPVNNGQPLRRQTPPYAAPQQTFNPYQYSSPQPPRQAPDYQQPSGRPGQTYYPENHANQYQAPQKPYSPSDPYMADNVTSSYYMPKDEKKQGSKHALRNGQEADPILARKKRVFIIKMSAFVSLSLIVVFLLVYLVFALMQRPLF
jgi:hypothetical protein